MIWIAWRYQRTVAYVLALLALLVIAFTLITGVIQHHYLIEYPGCALSRERTRDARTR